MLPSTRRALLILPIWLAATVWLWSWWLRASTILTPQLYFPLTIALLYQYMLIPSSYLFLILKAKYPKKRRPLLGKKVAVITPCVPSEESKEIIERQLQALAAINYPHDSWILDEGNSPDIKLLAKRYGVKYFSRKGSPKYNQDNYPFKAKTKAGNINAWLDKVKRRKYDFFVQLDIDHIPSANYLDKTLGHFRDKHVGWVQAPSVYGNLGHWIARGSAEQERGLQGPLQMGFYGNAEAPVIIGSHTTFRMDAIRQIGGFQQTRAEDHLNTLALVSHGWKGVYLPEIIAIGDGPETLSAYLSQQYAWAFSMIQIFKTYSHRHLRAMTTKHKLQFLFMQSWYPIWALSALTLFAIPIIGLFFNTSAVQISGTDFLLRCLPLFSATWLVWWAGKPLTQQSKVRLSWRSMVLQLISWPIILKAVTAAALGRTKPYQITPKGKRLKVIPTIRLYRPFLLLSLSSALAILFAANTAGVKASWGLMTFSSISAFSMLGVCLADLHSQLKKIKLKPQLFVRYWLKPMAAVTAVLVVSLAFTSSVSSARQIIYADISSTTQNQRDVSSLSPQSLSYQEIVAELSSKQLVTEQSTQTPSIGVYSQDAVVPSQKPYIRETFVDWRENRHLAEELLITKRVGAVPLITLEPKGVADGAVLLKDISRGAYDERLLTMLGLMADSQGTVYVRFAHEMDLSDVFPWGVQDPADYIAAYRHVVELARHNNMDNLRWVWSPAGNSAAPLYYPGDDVVDVVGSTLLYDRYWNGDYRPSFYELTTYRNWLHVYQKPVWITEYGVGNADPDFQRQLLIDGVEHYKDYGYDALIYINIHDSNLSAPDYRFDNVLTLSKTLGIFSSPAPKPVTKNPTCISLVNCGNETTLTTPNPGLPIILDKKL